jgi:hypothetical protein
MGGTSQPIHGWPLHFAQPFLVILSFRTGHVFIVGVELKSLRSPMFGMVDALAEYQDLIDPNCFPGGRAPLLGKEDTIARVSASSKHDR